MTELQAVSFGAMVVMALAFAFGAWQASALAVGAKVVLGLGSLLCVMGALYLLLTTL